MFNSRQLKSKYFGASGVSKNILYRGIAMQLSLLSTHIKESLTTVFFNLRTQDVVQSAPCTAAQPGSTAVINGHIFLSSIPPNWPMASIYCASNRMRLLEINSRQENRVIQNYLERENAVWIGAREENNQFIWSDDKLLLNEFWDNSAKLLLSA